MARTPIHPGEILGDELKEIGLSAKRLADVIKVLPNPSKEDTVLMCTVRELAASTRA